MTKIYEIHENNLVESEVRETQKMYLIGKPRWSHDYRCKLYKDEAFLNPQDAIKHHLNKTRNEISMREADLMHLKSKLNALGKLYEKYGCES